MIYLTKASILIKSENYSIEELASICEDYGLGEIDFADEDTVAYKINSEENYDISSAEDVSQWIQPLIENFEDIHWIFCGTFLNQEQNEYLDMEIEYKKGSMRVRETDWYVEEVIDDDMTYEEYEEEGYHNISEEDFDNYSHKKNKSGSREVSTKGKFGRWRSLD